MKKTVFFILFVIVLFFPGCSFSGTVPDADTETGNNTLDDAAAHSENESAVKGETTQNDFEIIEYSDEPIKEGIMITLYYQDKDRYVVPVTRRVPKHEGLARTAVTALIDSAANREEIGYYGLYPVLPKGTEILGINIKEDTAVVDLNKKLLEYKDSSDERNIITSLVYTLTEFKTIKGVQILINGHTGGKLKFGTDISEVLKRGNVFINGKRVNISKTNGKFDIYLFKRANDKYIYTLPMSAEKPKAANDGLPELIIESLSKKVENGVLTTEIPEGTKILESSLKGNLLVLNFNNKLINYGGTAREDGLLKQILYSMKQIDGAEKVRILVEGKSIELPEGTDISKSIDIPPEINDVIDKQNSERKKY